MSIVSSIIAVVACACAVRDGGWITKDAAYPLTASNLGTVSIRQHEIEKRCSSMKMRLAEKQSGMSFG